MTELEAAVPAGVGAAAQPEVQWATAVDFRWSADMPAENARVVYFSGPGGRLIAHLMKGSLDGEGAFGLWALGRPAFLRKVTSPWQVFLPHEHLGHDNTGKNRKVLQLISPREQITLRFVQEIPRSLNLALRVVFEKKKYRKDKAIGVKFAEEGEGNEEHEHGQVGPAAEIGVEPKGGLDPERRLDAEHG